jgi:hypothetical protein
VQVGLGLVLTATGLMLYYAAPKYERWRQYVERQQSEPLAAAVSGRKRRRTQPVPYLDP